MNDIKHWFLHVDLDAFFASVEQMDHPEYRGKPLIVGGKPEDRRSVVSTASYEARKYGVHSAMPTFQAYKLCPNGIFVYPRMERYAELSYKIMNIFKNYSPDVQQMSIDEAFIDLTGTERLFGSPEETARKLKADVKAQTGLTVSVGLASTKYLAKIASGFSKPDGFYYIHHGDEEKFMLDLPLDKVWGLGVKSLELLRSKGIKSTRDIYEMPYETLEFLFGQNMGTFLYDVVRGQNKDSFSRKTKSHSISAENTFAYDLTDIYTIETELLELCQGVYFRLLKEKAFSRTAFVKIRYEDFSTSTVQETLDHNIMTLDSYFEIIRQLFEKKYEEGRGIRLLGVGFENIETEERPYQQDLFENNDKKKRAVENAILKLQQKHPEIKIKKARTIKAVLLFSLILTCRPDRSFAQKTPAMAPLPQKAPDTLFNWKIDDANNVDFLLSGYWNAQISDSSTVTFGKKSPVFQVLPPVFTQEVSLSMWLLLNKHWYFEADFADQFKKNTVAIGYQGEGFVRSLRIANRGITIDNTYSADTFGFGLKGGKNQAPGFSTHLQSSDDRLEIDLLARYDMTASKSATFYGMNSVTEYTAGPEDFLYGYSYRFPKDAGQAFSQIKDIYVEDYKGSYTSSDGKHYKKLALSQYLYYQWENRLYLAQSAGAGKQVDSKNPSKKIIPQVLVTFTDDSTVTNVIAASGNYNESESFFGQIQKEFSKSASQSWDLSKYTPSLSCEIEGSKALLIQNPGFSPYLCPDTYFSSSQADVYVQNTSSGTISSHYICEENDMSFTELNEDFFTGKGFYTQITNASSKESVYPFADSEPEIYLGLTDKANLTLLYRTYSPVSDFNIGTEAAAGSVIVYKNDIIDSGAAYNPDTGIVSLSSRPSDVDKVYITWQEDATSSSTGSTGAFTGGAGLIYHFTPELTADGLISSRWSFSGNKYYSTMDNLNNGFAAFSTGINYSKSDSDKALLLSDKAAVSVHQQNTLGGLLVTTQPAGDSKTKDNRVITYHDENINVITLGVLTGKSSITEGQNYSTEVRWTIPSTTSISELKDTDIAAVTYFNSTDFSIYEKIEFKFAVTVSSKAGLTLILDDKASESLTGNTALKLELKDISKYTSEAVSYHTISIDIKNKTLTIDNSNIAPSEYELFIDSSVIPGRQKVTVTSIQGDGSLYINDLTYKTSSIYASLQNKAEVSFKKAKILDVEDFSILKDFNASFKSSQSTGNLNSPELNLLSSAEAGVTITGIKLHTDLTLDKTSLTAAGHSLKTEKPILNTASIEENYRYTKIGDLKKDNKFALDFSSIKLPLTLNFRTLAQTQNKTESQALEAGSKLNLKTGENSPSGLLLGLGFTAGQKVNGIKNNIKLESPDYFEGYGNISRLQFSTGKEEASLRNTEYRAKMEGSLPFAKFKPYLEYQLKSDYTSTKDALFKDYESLTVAFPFTISSQTFSFKLNHFGQGTCDTSFGGTYISDSQKLFDLQKDRSWVYNSIPFYELFNDDIKKRVTADYAAKYEASYKRNLYNSLKDLYIPSGATFTVIRNINNQSKSSSDFKASDIYQFKATISNTSLNNFGSSSIGHYFDWFKQEEVISQITAAVKYYPQLAENTLYSLSSFIQALLFINDDASILCSMDGSLETNLNWSAAGSLSYRRKGKSCFFVEAARFLIPAAKTVDFAISRTDTLNVEVSNKDDILRQNYRINHAVDMKFLKYFTVTSGIGGEYLYVTNTSNTLGINLSIGGKAEF